jgi:hypothetical protein
VTRVVRLNTDAVLPALIAFDAATVVIADGRGACRHFRSPFLLVLALGGHRIFRVGSHRSAKHYRLPGSEDRVPI